MTPEPPRHRLEMPFLLMAGMVISAFVGCVAALAALLQAAHVFSSMQIFGESTSSSLGGAIQSGFIQSLIVWGLVAAVAWGLWREQWWSRPVMVGFWVVLLTIAVVLTARGVEQSWSGCLPLSGLVLSISYLYGKGNVRAYYRVLESRALPKGKGVEGEPGGVA